MHPTDRLVLPAEVIVFPVAALAPSVRAAIGGDPGHYGVTRERSRRTTRVVDRATAELLEEFRKPSSTVEAIHRFVRRGGLDVATVVEACVPMLNEFIGDGFIVPVGMESAAVDGNQLRVGESLGRWEVLEPLQIVEDSEVYRVRSADGAEAALKRVLPAPSRGSATRCATRPASSTGSGGRRHRRSSRTGRVPRPRTSWSPGARARR